MKSFFVVVPMFVLLSLSFVSFQQNKQLIVKKEDVFEEGKVVEFPKSKLIITSDYIGRNSADVTYTLPNLKSDKIENIKIATTKCKTQDEYELCVTCLGIYDNRTKTKLRIHLYKTQQNLNRVTNTTSESDIITH